MIDGPTGQQPAVGDQVDRLAQRRPQCHAASLPWRRNHSLRGCSAATASRINRPHALGLDGFGDAAQALPAVFAPHDPIEQRGRTVEPRAGQFTAGDLDMRRVRMALDQAAGTRQRGIIGAVEVCVGGNTPSVFQTQGMRMAVRVVLHPLQFAGHMLDAKVAGQRTEKGEVVLTLDAQSSLQPGQRAAAIHGEPPGSRSKCGGTVVNQSGRTTLPSQGGHVMLERHAIDQLSGTAKAGKTALARTTPVGEVAAITQRRAQMAKQAAVLDAKRAVECMDVRIKAEHAGGLRVVVFQQQNAHLVLAQGTRQACGNHPGMHRIAGDQKAAQWPVGGANGLPRACHTGSSRRAASLGRQRCRHAPRRLGGAASLRQAR